MLSFVVVASNNDIKWFYVSFDTPVADGAQPPTQLQGVLHIQLHIHTYIQEHIHIWYTYINLTTGLHLEPQCTCAFDWKCFYPDYRYVLQWKQSCGVYQQSSKADNNSADNSFYNNSNNKYCLLQHYCYLAKHYLDSHYGQYNK